MPQKAKIIIATAVISVSIALLAFGVIRGLLSMTGVDPVERRAAVAFGHEVENTLLPIVTQRDAPLSAADAKRIVALEQEYNHMQNVARDRFWRQSVELPDAPFFKKLRAYDGEKMSAFQQTILLDSVAYDLKGYADKVETLAAASTSTYQNGLIITIALVSFLIIVLVSHDVAEHILTKGRASKRAV